MRLLVKCFVLFWRFTNNSVWDLGKVMYFSLPTMTSIFMYFLAICFWCSPESLDSHQWHVTFSILYLPLQCNARIFVAGMWNTSNEYSCIACSWRSFWSWRGYKKTTTSQHNSASPRKKYHSLYKCFFFPFEQSFRERSEVTFLVPQRKKFYCSIYRSSPPKKKRKEKENEKETMQFC